MTGNTPMVFAGVSWGEISVMNRVSLQKDCAGYGLSRRGFCGRVLGATAACAGLSASGGGAEPVPAGKPDFPLVDYHVHLSPQLPIEKAVALSKERGVEFGIVEHPSRLAAKDGFSGYIDLLDRYPVYKGIQPERPGWKKRVPTAFVDQLDYVLMDAMILPIEGRRFLHLWLRGLKVDNKEAFMDRLADFTVAVILEESIDILGSATFLPHCLVAEYDALWTTDRMQRLIEAALHRNVAFEINAQYEVPKAGFIRMAKEAGARFSFGTNSRDEIAGKLDYCIGMAMECGLDKKDLFLPQVNRQTEISLIK